MKEAQLPPGEVRLAAEGVQQLRRCADARSVRVQHQRHGIDRDIPAGQVVFEAAGAHHGVGPWPGVHLLPG